MELLQSLKAKNSLASNARILLFQNPVDGDDFIHLLNCPRREDTFTHYLYPTSSVKYWNMFTSRTIH